MAASGALTKHGFPCGYRFSPHSLEIIAILADHLCGRPLPPQMASIFHDIRVLSFHPEQLYERFKAFQEDGYIYFFSRQEYKGRSAGAGAGGKKINPQRQANGGVWKASGAGKPLTRPQSKGGGVAGRMVTMVFYNRQQGVDKLIKTDWGMHEYTVCLGPNQFSNLAVYRLYKVKNGGAKGGGNQLELEGGVHLHDVPPVAASSSAAAGTPSYMTGQASSSSHHQEQNQLITINEHQFTSSYAAGGASSSVIDQASSSTSYHQDQKQKQMMISIEQQMQQHYMPSTSAPPSYYATGTSFLTDHASSSSHHQEQNQLVSIDQQMQHYYHNQYAAMPEQTSMIWVQQQQQLVSPSLPETTAVDDPWEQQLSPVTDHYGFTSPDAHAMFLFQEGLDETVSQFAAGHDETIKESPSSSSQLEVVPPEHHFVMPPEFEGRSMSALLNEDDDKPKVPLDLIDPLDYFGDSDEDENIASALDDFMG